MRATGVGEVALALKIKQFLEDPSKNIQAKGVELARKYLGMAKETVDIQEGITIVIKGTEPASTGPTQGALSRPTQPNPGFYPPQNHFV